MMSQQLLTLTGFQDQHITQSASAKAASPRQAVTRTVVPTPLVQNTQHTALHRLDQQA